MTIRVYSSLDTGAPVLAGSTYDRLRTILLSCLVTGFSGKPGAGWSLVHDVSGGCSFGNGVAVLNLVSLNDFNVQLYSMEFVNNPGTALAGGYNRRSGRWADDTSTDRQTLYGWNLLSTSSGQNPHWVVVADAHTCIVVLGSATATSDVGSCASFYFGRYQNALGLTGPAEWCCLGGYFGPNSNISQWFLWASNSFGARAGTLLRNPITGLVLPPSASFVGASSSSSQPANSGVKLAALTRLSLSRASIWLWGEGTNGPVGYMRGVLQDTNLCSASYSEVLALLGRPNTWQQRVTPLELPGGKLVLPYWPSSTIDSAYFISLDPADWEDL